MVILEHLLNWTNLINNHIHMIRLMLTLNTLNTLNTLKLSIFNRIW